MPVARSERAAEDEQKQQASTRLVQRDGAARSSRQLLKRAQPAGGAIDGGDLRVPNPLRAAALRGGRQQRRDVGEGRRAVLAVAGEDADAAARGQQVQLRPHAVVLVLCQPAAGAL